MLKEELDMQAYRLVSCPFIERGLWFGHMSVPARTKMHFLRKRRCGQNSRSLAETPVARNAMTKTAASASLIHPMFDSLFSEVVGRGPLLSVCPGEKAGAWTSTQNGSIIA